MARNTKSIEIDLEIYRLITNERRSFEETENEILRRILGLGQTSRPSDDSGGINLGYGVFLPDGSSLRKIFKGREYQQEVKGGYIWVNGEKYTSASGAAVAITGYPVDGWKWWEVKRPQDANWILLDKLRSSKPSRLRKLAELEGAL